MRVLPGLGRDGDKQRYSLRPQQLCTYLLRDFPSAKQLDTLDLLAPVNRALKKLEQARLVAAISHQRTPVWRITPLGETILTEGTIRQHLEPAG